MKTKLIFFGLLCFVLSFGQNRSVGGISPFDSPPSINAPQLSEIFRFRSGLVTQLDLGTSFTPENQWFALGRVSLGPAATQAFYGARFQTPNNALVMGFTSTSPNNPRIEWIGDGANTGNLEFRVGLGFGSPGFPGANLLVGSMNSDGSITFGDGSTNNAVTKLTVVQDGSILGLATGIESIAFNGSDVSIGVKGVAGTVSNFAAGIYGESQIGVNQWAGFFDGRVFGTNFNRPSDRRLKYEIAPADPAMQKIAKMQPVTYKYIKTDMLNLDEGLQHGFIAQDIEKIFPELITEVNKPVFDKNGKVKEMYKFKTVDYMGMISILVGGIQELNDKVTKLESQLAYKTEKSSLKTANGLIEKTKAAFME